MYVALRSENDDHGKIDPRVIPITPKASANAVNTWLAKELDVLPVILLRRLRRR